jgi:hypothetical protein
MIRCAVLLAVIDLIHEWTTGPSAESSHMLVEKSTLAANASPWPDVGYKPNLLPENIHEYGK